MVGATNDMKDNMLRQQLEGVIDDELQKLEFTSLCKKIALKVVERVQQIDDEHNKIKSLYGELGARVAGFLTESDSHVTLNRTDRITTQSFEARNNSTATNVGHNIISSCNNKDANNGEVNVDLNSPKISTSVSSSVHEINNDKTNDLAECIVESSEKRNSIAIPEKEGLSDIVNRKSIRTVCTPFTRPTSEPSVSTYREHETITVEDTSEDQATVEDNTVDIIKEGDKQQCESNENNERTDNALGEDSVLNVDARNESPTNSDSSQLDVSESDGQSCSSIPNDATIQSESPLTLEITTATESHKTTESNEYSSTMVTPVTETEVINSCRPSEVASSSTTTVMPSEVPSSSTTTIRAAKRKPFKFKAGTIVYAKPCGSDIWYEAELLKEVVIGGKKQPKYQVRFMGGQRLRQKILLKSIATKDPAGADQFEIGTRIVAGRPSDTVNNTISKKYKDISSGNNIIVMFAGIVAELACNANRNRYLVFFDDGYAQYFNIASLFLVIKPSRNVWNDVTTDCQGFIQEYLQEYPYRTLVCTKVNSSMQTEWNGEWWKAKVVSVDASLIKVLFDVDKRSEWIYRGTTRLEPLYKYYNPPKTGKRKKKNKAANEENYVDEMITHPEFGVSRYSLQDPDGKRQWKEWDVPYIEVMSPSVPSVPVSEDESAVNTLRFESGVGDLEISKDARKTSPPAFNLEGALQTCISNGIPSSTAAEKSPISSGNKMYDRSRSNIVHIPRFIDDPPAPPLVSLSPKKRGPHLCDESCIQERRKIVLEHNLGIFNYLSIPFNLGWQRESSKKKTGSHRDIYYRTPCNRRLRNLAEVTSYIAITKCTNVAIDMFCFHPSVSCRNQSLIRPKPTFAKIDDLSGGKETCPVVCINEINEELPNPIVYISNRMPAEDVYINTDPGFLTCCDCVDNCQDKSKCGCAQLTIENSKVIDNVVNENAGYQYRRLKETITTGIYECNQNCLCSRETCYNRVVQNGIQLRLQVFMTENRGWGLRCIDDIPKGTFICTYAGQVLNEQTANREGMDFGDEYLAELDHIEVMEKAKDDYESDVPELRDSIMISSGDDSDSDSSSSVLSISSDSSEESTTKKLKMTDKFHEIARPLNANIECTDSILPHVSTDSIPPQADMDISAVPLQSDMDISMKPDLNELCQDPLQNLASCEADVSGEISLLSSNIDDVPSLLISLQGTANSEDTIHLPSDGEAMVSVMPVQNDVILSDITAPSLTMDPAPSLAVDPAPILAVDPAPSLAIDPTISGRALARKSTSNKAYAHKSIRGKKSRNLAANVSAKTESTRGLYGGDKQLYVIDAKCFGNVGRFLNHSCSPNLFVQNVMFDTHDLRFPWVAFFALQNILAYTELTWDYNYEIGSVADKTLTCMCGSKNCKGRLL